MGKEPGLKSLFPVVRSGLSARCAHMSKDITSTDIHGILKGA